MKHCETCRSTYPDDFTTCPRDQGPLRDASELFPGVVLRGKYEILGRLGSGGMAAVYRAKHLAFGEVRAIKVVSDRIAAEPGFTKRFRSEAVMSRRLQHPHAVRVDDFDETEDGRPFIVMECVEGRSLRELIHAEAPLPPARAVEIARQVCLALGEAHRLGIVHRDIKPDNILMQATPDGSDHAKVMDFGIARIHDAEGLAAHTATQTGMVMGTPQYISPEQAMGKRGSEIDGRADLYSLGVVLYEMLTRRLPFDADTPMSMLLHHIQTAPRPLARSRPDLVMFPELAATVMRALAKDPARRFADAADMAAALARVAATLPEAAVPPPRPAAAADPDANTLGPGDLTTPRPLPTLGGSLPPSPPRHNVPTAPTLRPVPRASPPTLRARPAVVDDGGSSRGWWRTAGGAAVFVLLIAVGVQGLAPRATPPAPAQPAPVELADDARLQAEIQRVIRASVALRGDDLQVQVTNGIATLSGSVRTPVSAELAGSLARSVPGVKQVFVTADVATAIAEGPSSPFRREPDPVAAAGDALDTKPVDEAEEAVVDEPTTGWRVQRQSDPRVQALLEEGVRALTAGRTEDAKTAFTRALEIEPGNPKAQLGLRRIRLAAQGRRR